MIMPSVMVVERGFNVETPLWQKRWPFCMVDFNFGLCDMLGWKGEGSVRLCAYVSISSCPVTIVSWFRALLPNKLHGSVNESAGRRRMHIMRISV